MDIPRWTKTVAVAVTSAAAGSLVTYFTVKKHFEVLANEEIQSVKDHYRLIRKEDGSVGIFGEREPGEESSTTSASEMNAELLEAAKNLVGSLGYKDSDETVIERRSVFDMHVEVDEDGVPVEADAAEDKEDDFEEPVRSPDKPYIISVSEFMQDEQDYSKITLTYFEGDDTLCDENEMPIDDINGIVGNDSLEHFGFKSDNKSIVYVRNERLESDFEVVLDLNDYADKVLGLTVTKNNRPKKMRDED